MFLEASDEDLVRRFEATRRRHPLAPGDRVIEGIRKERLMMESLKGDADLIIDTSGMSPHELRDRVWDAFGHTPREQALQVSLVSFGYKHGLPGTPTWCSTSASCRTRTGSRRYVRGPGPTPRSGRT